MDNLIESIRIAVATDATDEVRAEGAAACRTILCALEGKPGEPLAAVTPQSSQIATVVSALRGVPPDQLLDLAIAKLRDALPAGATVAPVQPLKFHLIPMPQRGGRP